VVTNLTGIFGIELRLVMLTYLQTSEAVQQRVALLEDPSWPLTLARVCNELLRCR
jgi:hypothetical protein